MTLEFLREVQARLIARDRFNLRDMRVRSGPQLIYEFQQTLGKWRELIAHRNAQVRPRQVLRSRC
jgi:hypothetical protein